LDATTPLIVEAAINGATPKVKNPHVPRTVDEIVESAAACLEAGAAIVHNHNDEPNVGGPGRHASGPYAAAWARILGRFPGALLYPTYAGGGPHTHPRERYAHIDELREAGLLKMPLLDTGSVNFGGGRPLFGLPPTRASLDAYLDMLDDTGLPWLVAVLGGDVVSDGLAQLAIERGGHVRVGLEDFDGPRQPRNEDLVREVVALSEANGRPVATPEEAARLLDLPG
jgi:uncharacterized protein (DUF849 family)